MFVLEVDQLIGLDDYLIDRAGIDPMCHTCFPFNPKVPTVYSASDIVQQNAPDGDFNGHLPANQKPAFSMVTV